VTTRTRLTAAAVAAVLAALFVPATAHADRTITLTFIRHAESTANAAGSIDTTIPGPPLSDKGFQQADAAAHLLKADGYDAIYASEMVRSQQTAAPLATALDKQTAVLAGLDEISAGVFEGQPMTNIDQLLAAPMAWLNGDRSARIPGSVDGNEFDAAFDSAVATIYKSGHATPVAFSHLLTIMLGVLMNVINPDNSLFNNPGLPNLSRVVITGSPQKGWRLTSWSGKPLVS
jgi:broad specificity phosphatase PhoE